MLDALQDILENYLKASAVNAVNLTVVELEYMSDYDYKEQNVGERLTDKIPSYEQKRLNKDVKINLAEDGSWVSLFSLPAEDQVVAVQDSNNQVLDIVDYSLDNNNAKAKLYRCKSLSKPLVPLLITLSNPIHAFQERRPVKIKIELIAQRSEEILHDALAVLMQNMIDKFTVGLELTKNASENSAVISFCLYQPRLQLEGFSRTDKLNPTTKVKLALNGELEMTLRLAGKPTVASSITTIVIGEPLRARHRAVQSNP